MVKKIKLQRNYLELPFAWCGHKAMHLKIP